MLKRLLRFTLALALLLAAARACDVRGELFEDGSARITLCIPFQLCK